MTAINHSIETLPVSPSADAQPDPLHELAPNRDERRRIEVDRATAEVVKVAEDAGWEITRDRSFSKGASRYIDMQLSNSVAITLRVADHCPSRALGVQGDRPFLLVIVGISGGLSHAKRWLESMAEQVHRVQRGQTQRCRLGRRAV